MKKQTGILKINGIKTNYSIIFANTFLSRLFGLIGKNLLQNQGLLFPRCNSIHTFFMRWPIDVVFLDSHNKVVKLLHSLHPWKIVLPVKEATAVLEFPASTIATLSINIDDTLEALDNAVAIQQHDAYAYLCRAKTYREKEHNMEALKALDRALLLDCADKNILFDIYAERSHTLFAMNRFKLASENIAMALQLTALHEPVQTVDKKTNIKILELHFLSAKILRSMKMYKEALQKLRYLLNNKYKDDHLYLELSLVFEILGGYDKAIYYRKRCPRYNQADDIERLYAKAIKQIKESHSTGTQNITIREIHKLMKIIPQSRMKYRNILLNEMEICNNAITLSSKVRYLGVELTNKCNLQCIMCHAKNTPWVLSDAVRDQIINLMPYLEKISWEGGEVFLYNGYEHLLSLAHKNNVSQQIITNGLLLNDTICETIAQYNITLILSIDGITKNVYENIQKGANFDILMKNINLLNMYRKKHNIQAQLFMHTILMRSNYQQLEDFLRFAIRHNFNMLSIEQINCLTPEMHTQENINCAEIYQYIARKADRMQKIAEKNGIILRFLVPYKTAITDHGAHLNATTGQTKNTIRCYAPWQQLFITQGKAKPNSYCLQEVGDTGRESIAEIWNGEKIKEYRKNLLLGTFGENCNLYCKDGYITERENKNIRY